MPNRYEREIEEILRNMDETEPRQRLGDRIRAFNRRAPRSPRPRGPRTRLTRSEVLFVSGIVLALIGAGIAYYNQQAGIVSGIVSGAAFLVLLAGLIVEYRFRFRGYRSPSPWGGTVIDITPRRRHNPFSAIATQFRIIRLKWRYWRNRHMGRG